MMSTVLAGLQLCSSMLSFCQHDNPKQNAIEMCYTVHFAFQTAYMCYAVYLGIFEVKYFRSNLFDLHPESGMIPQGCCCPLPKAAGLQTS